VEYLHTFGRIKYMKYALTREYTAGMPSEQLKLGDPYETRPTILPVRTSTIGEPESPLQLSVTGVPSLLAQSCSEVETFDHWAWQTASVSL
jgi:hypothetical protein